MRFYFFKIADKRDIGKVNQEVFIAEAESDRVWDPEGSDSPDMIEFKEKVLSSVSKTLKIPAEHLEFPKLISEGDSLLEATNETPIKTDHLRIWRAPNPGKIAPINTES
ncbi:MAG: hypothetical protein JO308_02520 [Verrucomicrobia bacterium]|nr:hypothetical protein [Verrucomicrobiota bacterium]